MSLFRVKLQNQDQGLLDKHPTTGAQMSPSKQRQVYVMGPNRINRLLKDGDTFTDCNYWKKFAYPQVPYSQAFIEVVTDDGSVYVEGGSSTYPKVYNLVAYAGQGFGDNDSADILGDTGGYAVFCQITNSGTEDITVRINGKTDAVFTLEDGTAQVFNVGDLEISLIEVANTASGAATDVPVEVLVSVKSVCRS